MSNLRGMRFDAREHGAPRGRFFSCTFSRSPGPGSETSVRKFSRSNSPGFDVHDAAEFSDYKKNISNYKVARSSAINFTRKELFKRLKSLDKTFNNVLLLNENRKKIFKFLNNSGVIYDVGIDVREHRRHERANFHDKCSRYLKEPRSRSMRAFPVTNRS